MEGSRLDNREGALMTGSQVEEGADHIATGEDIGRRSPKLPGWSEYGVTDNSNPGFVSVDCVLDDMKYSA